MRPMFTTAPGEWLFAVLMAASPMIGSIWVTPDTTKWIVFAAGAVMTIAVILLGLRPTSVEDQPPA